MEMISKMKTLGSGPNGSRIASVHNGSSLFTGDAGSGESNIRRHIIENDMLEAIIQLPNNLFYNTGITTYIWLVSNKKAASRKGKVQLIDANLLFKKLRKNLGEKNCELTPEHIQEITQCYLNLSAIDRDAGAEGIASQVFDNNDFGYYKVTIERPDRRKAQFSETAISPLRYDNKLREVMEWIYGEWGDAIYDGGALKDHEKEILTWCEENELSLNTKARKKLLNPETWQKQLELLSCARKLMAVIGEVESRDFNQFKAAVDVELKKLKIKLSATEKKAILNAVSWYDETAEKVIKKKVNLTGDKLKETLDHLGCEQSDLADFGYYPTDNGEYITYEPNSDLRDSESIPLKEEIHQFYLDEVKPHVDEAWINMDSTKIGYEISFNKHFYRHIPLRSMKEVAEDIASLEQQAEGLIADLLGMKV